MSLEDKSTLPCPPAVSSVLTQVFIPSHLDYGALLEAVMERMTSKLDLVPPPLPLSLECSFQPSFPWWERLSRTLP